jgi:hypothetical protein
MEYNHLKYLSHCNNYPPLKGDTSRIACVLEGRTVWVSEDLWPPGAQAPKHSIPPRSQPVPCTLSLPWSQLVLALCHSQTEPACAHVETDTQSSLSPRAKPCPTAPRRLELTRMAWRPTASPLLRPDSCAQSPALVTMAPY